MLQSISVLPDNNFSLGLINFAVDHFSSYRWKKDVLHDLLYGKNSQGKQPKTRNCDQVTHNKTLQFPNTILQTGSLKQSSMI